MARVSSTRLSSRFAAALPPRAVAAAVRAAYPDVRVVEAVASDHAGTAELFLPPGGPGAGTSSVERGIGATVTVPRVPLDDLELRDVLFMKIQVMPGGRWLPLDDFDLIGHQRAAAARVDQSLVRRVLRPRPRSVNMVLFRPEQAR